MSSKNTGGWQKVGSEGKSKKANKTVKKQKDTKPKAIPKIEELAPLEIKKTAFESLIPVSNEKGHLGNGDLKATKKKKPQPQKQKQEPKYRFADIKDALQQVSTEDIEEKVKQVHKDFSNTSNQIFIKDFVTEFNSSLSCMNDSPALDEKPSSFPVCDLPKKSYKYLQTLLVTNSTNEDILAIYTFCIKSMLDNIERDTPAWGFRVCLQILAHHCALQCTVDLDKHLENILNRKNVPKRCLAHMWALGQNGIKTPKCGMQVWLEVMVPLMGVRNLSPFVISYIEGLVKNTKNPESQLAGTITAESFLTILQWCFDNSTNIQRPLRNRLLAIYPTLKSIAMASQSLQLFDKFLYSTDAEIQNYKFEYIAIATECLQTNKKCFSVWRKAYVDTFPMTRELLNHIESEWPTLSKSLHKTLLRETIYEFHNVNCDAKAQSATLTSKKEFKDIADICKRLQSHFTASETEQSYSFLWNGALVIMFALISTFLYDLYLHGGAVDQTMTYKKLDEIGVLKNCDIIWRRSKILAAKIYGWTRVNIFPLVAKLWVILQPYILGFGEMIHNLVQYLIINTEGVRTEAAKYIKALFEWGDDVAEVVWPYITSTFSSIYQFSTKVFNGEISVCCVKAFFWDYYIKLSNFTSSILSST